MIQQEKQKFRNKAKHIISGISEEEQKTKSIIINEKILQLIQRRKPANTIIFKPLNNREPLVNVLYNSLVRQTNLYLIGNSKENIKYYRLGFDADENLIKKKIEFQTLQKEVSETDVIFVPGLLFTENGNRLGKGGGWYDRFLSQINCYKIGVCFKEQIVEKLPTESNDIKMDLIISD